MWMSNLNHRWLDYPWTPSFCFSLHFGSCFCSPSRALLSCCASQREKIRTKYLCESQIQICRGCHWWSAGPTIYVGNFRECTEYPHHWWNVCSESQVQICRGCHWWSAGPTIYVRYFCECTEYPHHWWNICSKSLLWLRLWFRYLFYVQNILPANTSGNIPLTQMPNSSPFFTGRQDVLDHLEKVFIHQVNSRLSRHSCLLWGLGGIGKTQICLKFMEGISHK